MCPPPDEVGKEESVRWRSFTLDNYCDLGKDWDTIMMKPKGSQTSLQQLHNWSYDGRTRSFELEPIDPSQWSLGPNSDLTVPQPIVQDDDGVEEGLTHKLAATPEMDEPVTDHLKVSELSRKIFYLEEEDDDDKNCDDPQL